MLGVDCQRAPARLNGVGRKVRSTLPRHKVTPVMNPLKLFTILQRFKNLGIEKWAYIKYADTTVLGFDVKEVVFMWNDFSNIH